MRRAVFFTLGCLEVLVAALLIRFGLQLPSRSEVHETFEHAGEVTTQTSTQITLLRRQVNELRRPELREMAARLQAESDLVTDTLGSQHLDYGTLTTMSDSLGQVAGGLEGIAATLDAKKVGRLGNAFDTTASYLDAGVVPSADRAAKDLEESTKVLRTDAKRLGELTKAMPLDLKSAREVHDSLARFSEGLSKLDDTLSPKRVKTMAEGFRGLETSLSTGADQVQKLAGYSYPVVTFQGFRPRIESRKFWPDGEKIAEGLRKAAAGAKAGAEEMEALAGALPKLRGSLAASRKIADQTKDALALALKHRDKLEPLLKDMPEHATRLAEKLPQLGDDLARVLRDTKKMKEVAASLRDAQKGLDSTVTLWPNWQKTLTHSSRLLKQSQMQMQQTLANRPQVEAALRQTVRLSVEFSRLLPAFVAHLEAQLAEQETALAGLGHSVDQVTITLPAYERTTSQLVETGRLLAWLLASVAFLHGGYLVLSEKGQRAEGSRQKAEGSRQEAEVGKER
jgi:hypothetical protein